MPRYTFWHETSSESLPSAALITCIVVVYLLSLQRSRHFWWKKGTLPCTPRSTVLYLRKFGPVSVIRRVGAWVTRERQICHANVRVADSSYSRGMAVAAAYTAARR